MLCGCDKTIPGTIMALARLNIPGVILYGGSIAPGTWQGKDVTIQDVFEGIGAQAAGRISLVELKDLEDKACPGAGACGGQFTANTMAMVGRVPRRRGDGQRQHPGHRAREGRRRRTGRSARDDAAAPRRAPA